MFGIGKWKTEAWEGKVVKKEVVETDIGDDGSSTSFHISVEMPDGKVVDKKYWEKKFFESFNIGDTIVKRPGEKKPVKG